jgi:hypothetical protein
MNAPDPRDPSQLISPWKKVQGLVELRSQIDGLSNLEIYLLDTDNGRWCAEGDAQISFPNGKSDPYLIDYETVL